MAAVQIKTPEDVYSLFPEHQDVSVLLPRDFRLESGEKLSRPELRLRFHGDRNNPLIIALGGISSTRKVADSTDGRGWWRDLVGPGKAIDLDAYCVLGFDFLPNTHETARTISTNDQARALSAALATLGIDEVFGVVGASYGGMTALAFTAAFPHLAKRVCVISAAERPHPAATAQRGIQRRILSFAADCGRPEEGVALARQIAMTTYRSPEEFADRFNSAPGEAAGDPYDVCDYLISRGDAFRMDVRRYLTLSDSIDRHRVDPRQINVPTTLIASLSDQLVPAGDIRRLAAAIPAAVDLREIPSRYGHDAFLKDTDVVGNLVAGCLQEKAK